MSITLAHPFRIDSNGSAVTVEQGTLRHATETVTVTGSTLDVAVSTDFADFQSRIASW